MPIRIQRQATSSGWRIPEGCVNVGPGRWESPLVVTQCWARDCDTAAHWHIKDRHHLGCGAPTIPFASLLDAQHMALALYATKWLDHRRRELMQGELRGLNVACWCPLVDDDGNPWPCRGDVILDVANGGAL